MQTPAHAGQPHPRGSVRTRRLFISGVYKIGHSTGQCRHAGHDRPVAAWNDPPQQVRFIMGNPLITDTFHPNRWDYLYSIQPGGSQRQQERVSLVFNASDQLAGLAGDFMPGVSRDEQISVANPRRRARPQPRPANRKNVRRRDRCWSRFSAKWTKRKPFRYRFQNHWKPNEKRPASPGVLLSSVQASSALFFAAFAARCLRTSFGSAISGR